MWGVRISVKWETLQLHMQAASGELVSGGQ